MADEPQNTQPASSTEQKEVTVSSKYLGDLRDESQRYRKRAGDWEAKYKELEKEMKPLRETAKAHETLTQEHGVLLSSLRTSNLHSKLRGELASLGVTDAKRQDLAIRAAMPDLQVEYDDNHAPVGAFQDPLKDIVETLGLGKREEKQTEKTAPAPVTLAPNGDASPKDFQQIGQESLARVRSGRS
jgi:chromosome segregation ATPase